MLVNPGFDCFTMNVQLLGNAPDAKTLPIKEQNDLMTCFQLQHFVPICYDTNGRVLTRNWWYTFQLESGTLFNWYIHLTLERNRLDLSAAA
jgi:hypothetical protein